MSIGSSGISGPGGPRPGRPSFEGRKLPEIKTPAPQTESGDAQGKSLDYSLRKSQASRLQDAINGLLLGEPKTAKASPVSNYEEVLMDEAEESHQEDVESEAAENAAEENADDLADDLLKISGEKKEQEEQRRRRRQWEEEEEEIEEISEVSETASIQAPKRNLISTVGYSDDALAELAETQLPEIPSIGSPATSEGQTGETARKSLEEQSLGLQVEPPSAGKDSEQSVELGVEDPAAEKDAEQSDRLGVEAPVEEEEAQKEQREAEETSEADPVDDGKTEAEEELTEEKREAEREEQRHQMEVAKAEEVKQAQEQEQRQEEAADLAERRVTDESFKIFRLELESGTVAGQAERAVNEAELIQSAARDELDSAEHKAFLLRRKAQYASPEEAALLEARADALVKRAKVGTTEAAMLKSTADQATSQAETIGQNILLQKERGDKALEAHIAAQEAVSRARENVVQIESREIVVERAEDSGRRRQSRSGGGRRGSGWTGGESRSGSRANRSERPRRSKGRGSRRTRKGLPSGAPKLTRNPFPQTPGTAPSAPALPALGKVRAIKAQVAGVRKQTTSRLEKIRSQSLPRPIDTSSFLGSSTPFNLTEPKKGGGSLPRYEKTGRGGWGTDSLGGLGGGCLPRYETTGRGGWGTDSLSGTGCLPPPKTTGGGIWGKIGESVIKPSPGITSINETINKPDPGTFGPGSSLFPEPKTSFSNELKDALNDISHKSAFGLDSLKASKEPLQQQSVENLEKEALGYSGDDSSASGGSRRGSGAGSSEQQNPQAEKKQKALVQKKLIAKQRTESKVKRLVQEAKKSDKKARAAATALRTIEQRMAAIDARFAGRLGSPEHRAARAALEAEAQTHQAVLQWELARSQSLSSRLQAYQGELSGLQTPASAEQPVSSQPGEGQSRSRERRPEASRPSTRAEKLELKNPKVPASPELTSTDSNSLQVAHELASSAVSDAHFEAAKAEQKVEEVAQGNAARKASAKKKETKEEPQQNLSGVRREAELAEKREQEARFAAEQRRQMQVAKPPARAQVEKPVVQPVRESVEKKATEEVAQRPPERVKAEAAQSVAPAAPKKQEPQPVKVESKERVTEAPISVVPSVEKTSQAKSGSQETARADVKAQPKVADPVKESVPRAPLQSAQPSVQVTESPAQVQPKPAPKAEAQVEKTTPEPVRTEVEKTTVEGVTQRQAVATPTLPPEAVAKQEPVRVTKPQTAAPPAPKVEAQVEKPVVQPVRESVEKKTNEEIAHRTPERVKAEAAQSVAPAAPKKQEPQPVKVESKERVTEAPISVVPSVEEAVTGESVEDAVRQAEAAEKREREARLAAEQRKKAQEQSSAPRIATPEVVKQEPVRVTKPQTAAPPAPKVEAQVEKPVVQPVRESVEKKTNEEIAHRTPERVKAEAAQSVAPAAPKKQEPQPVKVESKERVTEAPISVVPSVEKTSQAKSGSQETARADVKAQPKVVDPVKESVPRAPLQSAQRPPERVKAEAAQSIAPAAPKKQEPQPVKVESKEKVTEAPISVVPSVEKTSQAKSGSQETARADVKAQPKVVDPVKESVPRAPLQSAQRPPERVKAEAAQSIAPAAPKKQEPQPVKVESKEKVTEAPISVVPSVEKAAHPKPASQQEKTTIESTLEPISKAPSKFKPARPLEATGPKVEKPIERAEGIQFELARPKTPPAVEPVATPQDTSGRARYEIPSPKNKNSKEGSGERPGRAVRFGKTTFTQKRAKPVESQTAGDGYLTAPSTEGRGEGPKIVRPIQRQDMEDSKRLRARRETVDQSDEEVLFRRELESEQRTRGSQTLFERTRPPEQVGREEMKLRKERLERSELPTPMTVWEKSADPELEGEVERLKEQERTLLKKTLRNLTSSSVNLRSIDMTDDTSKVYAEVEEQSPKTTAEIGYMKQDFKEKTGRDLVTDQILKASPEKEPVVQPLPEREIAREPLEAPADDYPPVEEDVPDVRAELKSSDRERPQEKSRLFVRSRSSIEKPVQPKKPNEPFQQWGALEEKQEGVSKLRGRGRRAKGVRFTTRGGGSGGGGSAGRTAKYRPPEKELEQFEEKDKSRETEGKSGKTVETIRLDNDLQLVVTRSDLTQEQERSGGEGGSEPNTVCSTCGTELPPAQASNCPVCAQAGQEILALSKTNYRFSGSKMFATADTIVASEKAKSIIETQQLVPLANLKYWPKLPGHREILQLKKQA